jgi:hypothetical protein
MFRRLRFDLQAGFLILNSELKFQKKHWRFNNIEARRKRGSKYFRQMSDKGRGVEEESLEGCNKS